MTSSKVTKVIIIDTETTGFEDPRVIELGMLEVGLTEDMALEALHFPVQCFRYNPEKPIEPGAMATHFIENSDLEEEPSYTTAALPSADYLIGHSVDYDWGVMGKPQAKRICTHALATMLWPTASHKLGALIYLIDPAFARSHVRHAHGVVVDVMLCQRLLEEIIKKVPHLSSWEDLWQLSEVARVPTIMPFGKHKGEPMNQVPDSYKAWLRRQPDVDPYLLKAL